MKEGGGDIRIIPERGQAIDPLTTLLTIFRRRCAMNAAKKIKVLHIDDDPTFLEIFKTMFRSDFDITSRDSAIDMLAALEEGGMDALVLDYEMPGRNGIDVLREVRERHPSMPVLFYTGQGIEPSLLPKIFDMSFTTNRQERFGLGLAIVKKLVEAHGGTIRAESEGPAQGAAFIITLPHGA